jgi:hypothetical protein
MPGLRVKGIVRQKDEIGNRQSGTATRATKGGQAMKTRTINILLKIEITYRDEAALEAAKKAVRELVECGVNVEGEGWKVKGREKKNS